MPSKRFSVTTILIVLISFLFISLSSQAAGFDCKQAATAIEKRICNSPELNKLDTLLAAKYHQAMRMVKDPDELKYAQRHWLNETRNKCLDTVCLLGVYRERFDELKRLVNKNPYIPPDFLFQKNNYNPLSDRELDDFHAPREALLSTYAKGKSICSDVYAAYWASDKSTIIHRLQLVDTSENRYGYASVWVAWPKNKPYAIVYLDNANGILPGLTEAWEVNAGALRELVNRDVNPEDTKQTYSEEFSAILLSGEKLSSDPLYPSVYEADGKYFLVSRECDGGWYYGDYVCQRVIKLTVKRLSRTFSTRTVCKFEMPKKHR